MADPEAGGFQRAGDRAECTGYASWRELVGRRAAQMGYHGVNLDNLDNNATSNGRKKHAMHATAHW